MTIKATKHPALAGFPPDRRQRIVDIAGGLERVLRHVEAGKLQTDACHESDVIELAGSAMTAKRYWRLVRNEPVERWVEIISYQYRPTVEKSAAVKKRLGPYTEAAMLHFLAGRKFYSIAEVYRVCELASQAHQEALPSSKWFERYLKRGLGTTKQKNVDQGQVSVGSK